MSKKNWSDYLSDLIKTVFLVVFICGVFYLVYYAITARNQGMIPQEVIEINEWEYSFDGNEWEAILFPCNIAVEDGQTVYYRGKLPKIDSDEEWLATLNSKDMVVNIDGNERFVWERDSVRIPGGPAKSVYMFVPVHKSDSGKEILISKSGRLYNGAMEKVIVGDALSVVESLKKSAGSFQLYAASFILFISVILIVIGIVLEKLYKNYINLVPLGMGVMCASSWLIMDSNAFQLVTGVRYVDGFLSYILTLIMIFPFIAYIDGLQKHKFKKIYMVLAVIQLASFLICTILHITQISNFFNMLFVLDFIIAWIVIVILICTGIDLVRKEADSYKIVAVGFLIFGFCSIMEIAMLNNKVKVHQSNGNVRVDGGFILLGLFLLMVFAVIQQIDELKRYHTKRMAEEEAYKAKTDFLTNMSHEIRTPINTILGMNEMIRQEAITEKVREYSERIGHSGFALLGIINDILDYSLTQTDKVEIVNRDYKVKNLIDDATSILKVSASEKGLSTNIGLPAELPEFLNGDEKHIGRVLSNLISNAVKYTDTGVITFTLDCQRNNAEEYVLEFCVKDTGKGIKKEDIPNLFDPFFRSEIEKNRSLDGTGLGLAIAKDFLDRMGGEIYVDSQYGKGSTFTVRIPQRRAKSEDTFSTEVLNNFVATGMQLSSRKEIDDIASISTNYIAPDATILAVDDNNSNLVVIREFLKAIKARVDLVSSGSEAIEICNVNQYDIILMDHMMPEPDGVEAMHKIKEGISSLNRKTPIVVLTANAIGDCRNKYIEEGFDNYLSKPVIRDVLLKTIRKYIDPKLVVEIDPNAEKEAVEISPIKEEESSIIDFKALGSRFENQSSVINMVLSESVKEGEKKIILLREVFEQGDIPRYAVEAHGVKGVMASICAYDFSERAKKHEFAGKENRVDFIKDDIDGFLEEYRQVLDFIIEYLGKRGIVVKKPVSVVASSENEESAEILVARVEDALDEFDADKALKLIDRLSAAVTDDKKALVEEVRQYTDDFQYDEAKNVLEKLL